MVINNVIYLLVEKNGFKGMLKGNGAVLLNVENSRIDHVLSNDGQDFLIVSRNGNTGIWNLDQKELVTPKYSDIQYDNAGGFILTSKDNLKGAYFLNHILIGPKYTTINLISTGNYAKVKTQNGKSGYINNAGVEFFEE